METDGQQIRTSIPWPASTALIALATVLALIYAKKVPEPVLIGVAALVGLKVSFGRVG